MNSPITIETIVNTPIETVWDAWNKPEHITKWAFASDDWQASNPQNDLRTGGKFQTTMSAKDKSASFDFGGVYTNVEDKKLIEYDMTKAPNEENARHVKVVFKETPDGVKITQSFDPENENPIEMQQTGWQAILDNFKKYAESLST